MKKRLRRDAPALKRGADELMNLAEYALRDRKRTLRQIRGKYKQFCVLVIRAIKRGSA